jgi:1,4-dihydroxy-2-naphthoyl-CoA hydrolase
LVATPPPPESDDRRLFPSGRHDIHELLDVEVIEAGPERVVLRLPVTWKVHQPYGILHGGVSALLAESAASFGASLAAGRDRQVVGIELNASHLRSVADRPDRRRESGHLRRPLHPGRARRPGRGNWGCRRN